MKSLELCHKSWTGWFCPRDSVSSPIGKEQWIGSLAPGVHKFIIPHVTCLDFSSYCDLGALEERDSEAPFGLLCHNFRVSNYLVWLGIAHPRGLCHCCELVMSY